MKELELIFKGGFEVEDKVQIGNFEIVKISNIGLTMELSYENGVLIHTNIYQNDKVEMTKEHIIYLVKNELEFLANNFGVSQEVFFKSHKRAYAYKRFALSYILRLKKLTFDEIGYIMGGKSHDTIMHHANECQKAFEGYNPELKQEIEAMMQKLGV